ncbi:MAG: anti-sigma regulatory factor [Cyanobacteria bacterium Co-bin8]|nr:anti-sigma regulatory factor [Cyanobacteria bacterium Co-bin8]
MTILQQSQIQTTTDREALKQVLVWFDQFQEPSVPHDVWLQCQLALIEGLTNVIRHAHQGLSEETPIQIEVTLSPQVVDIRIWDQGPGFDLDTVLQGKLATTTPDSEGGRGLRIMHRVADTLDYQPTSDQRNCLHIQKRY